MVHLCVELEAGLKRNRYHRSGKVDLFEPPRLLQCLKHGKVECVEGIHTGRVGCVQLREDPCLHEAMPVNPSFPEDLWDFNNAVEPRGEVQVEPCVHLDEGLVNLHNSFGAGHCVIEAGLLRGVHVEVPIPAEIGDLLGFEVEQAALGAHVPLTATAYLGVAVLCLHALHVHHLLQHTWELGLWEEVQSALLRTAVWLRSSSVEPKVSTHLGEGNQVMGLHWHVGKVEAHKLSNMGKRRQLLRGQPHTGNA
mmetsp:Transcript_26947/g.74093  ORF Transcript_26947/g.74093 Transcript_26947/m.74093 type:complete len:251 (-) Transcript_26947:486-1238(-)